MFGELLGAKALRLLSTKTRFGSAERPIALMLSAEITLKNYRRIEVPPNKSANVSDYCGWP